MLEFYEPGAAIIEDSVAGDGGAMEQDEQVHPEYDAWRTNSNARRDDLRRQRNP